MAATRATPYQSVLRAGVSGTEIPDELATEDTRHLLCRNCARTFPRADMSDESTPPFTRILIATDGSPAGNDAVSLGVALARLAVAPVVLLHAAMPWRGGAWLARFVAAADASVDPGCVALAEACLDRARVVAMNAGVRFETRLAYDPHPDRAIVQAVRDTGCDLVVMGYHKGHVARRVGAHAGVPLLTCHERTA